MKLHWWTLIMGLVVGSELGAMWALVLLGIVK